MKRQTIYLLIVVFCAVMGVATQKPRVSIDRCAARLIFYRGGYHGFVVDYCYGFQFNEDGSERHLYHKPHLYYVDVRKLLKDSRNQEVKQ